jgi:phi13 family phage major tail protein
MSDKLGCSNFQIEEVLTDTTAAYITDTPITFTDRLQKIKFVPNKLKKDVDADDGVVSSYSAVRKGTLTVQLVDVTPAEQKTIFGSSNVGAIVGCGDCVNTPYFCAKWQENYNDKTIYYEVLKVKFEPIDEEAETAKSDSIDTISLTLEGTAIVRTYKHTNDLTANNLYYKVDTLDASYASEGTTWYSAGDNLSTPDLVAPTQSVVPIDSATEQSATVNVVWTFDKAILPSTMTADNFFIVADTDGAAVAAALSIGTNNTVVTLNPTNPLSAGASYRAIVTQGVKSLAGTALAANAVTKFTIQS